MSFFNKPTHNQQLDIIDIADNLNNCKQAGDKFRADCPICESQSSKPFVLFPNGGYYCHSCNEKGGAFKLITDVFKLNYNNFRHPS